MSDPTPRLLTAPRPKKAPTPEEVRRFHERLARWLADVAQNGRRAA